MKLLKNIQITLLAAGLVALGGCGQTEPEVVEAQTTPRSVAEAVQVSKHTPASLSNYKLAREYSAAGRYELAREHFLLALAAADDKELQDALVMELNSIEMMIKSLR